METFKFVAKSDRCVGNLGDSILATGVRSLVWLSPQTCGAWRHLKVVSELNCRIHSWYQRIRELENRLLIPNATFWDGNRKKWRTDASYKMDKPCMLSKEDNNQRPHVQVYKHRKQPRLVWLSGLSAGLQTKGSLVQFPVRARAWVCRPGPV